MVAYNMQLKRPPPPTSIVPPTGLKVWSDDLDPKLKGKARDQDSSTATATDATGSSSTAKTSSSGPLSWKEKQRRVAIGKAGEPVYSIGSFLAAGGGAWVLGLLLFLLWWRPHMYWTGGASTGAFLVGLLLSYVYFSNVKRKEQHQQVLSLDPGLKGCQYLLGTLPSWISLTEREKMEWLNRLLEEVWPFYDRGICDMVKQIVEPIMEQYRPPGMKRIFFQELTFGEAPFRVEGIAVRDVEDHIDLEVDVRWVGDANISLGIELPLGGDFTRLNPKVKDIVFVATLKIVLQPLVEEIPGFAAAAVALKGPPIIKYRLDFGSLPSTVTTVVTAPITAFVGFIVDLITGMFLWPKRLTVPILGSAGWVFPKEDPVIDLEVERLAGRQQGVVKVHVINAKGLKSYDTLTGKSDPFVEVYTTNDHRSKTRVISNSLSPTWDEKLYLPVLEKDTVLRVEMFDHDAVNISSVSTMTQLSLAGKEFMGRAAVPLTQFISEDGMEDEFTLPLGKGDWTNLEGPGHGEGVLKIGIQYRSIETIPRDEVMRANKGLLFVGVLCCYNLGGPKQSSYVTVKLSGDKKVNKESFKTPTIKAQPNPRWFGDNKFTLYDVRAEDSLVVTVMAPALTVDDEIGHVTMPMTTIRDSVQFSRWAKKEQQGYIHRDFPLDSSSSSAAAPRIVLELEFLPYW